MAKTDDPVVIGCVTRVLGPFIDILDFFAGKLWSPQGLGPPVQNGGAEWGSEENILTLDLGENEANEQTIIIYLDLGTLVMLEPPASNFDLSRLR